MHRVYIALGSNLDNPKIQIKEAIKNITKLKKTIITHESSLYETNPVGLLDQPNFINSVIEIKTDLLPKNLLYELQKIEKNAGRIREKINGPRTIDLDILLFDDLILNSYSLLIPHPRMHDRLFVLMPLFEINPNINIPGFGNIKNIMENIPKEGVIKI